MEELDYRPATVHGKVLIINRNRGELVTWGKTATKSVTYYS